MAGSANVLVRKAVIDGLMDLTSEGESLEGVDVKYAWQVGDRPREQVFTLRARAETPPAALRSGRNHREEIARFEVVILVESVGGNPEDADERAMEIGTVVEEFLADRKSNELGVAGLKWIYVESWELTPRSGDNSSFAELIYTVTYQARLA